MCNEQLLFFIYKKRVEVNEPGLGCVSAYNDNKLWKCGGIREEGTLLSYIWEWKFRNRITTCSEHPYYMRIIFHSIPSWNSIIRAIYCWICANNSQFQHFVCSQDCLSIDLQPLNYWISSIFWQNSKFIFCRHFSLRKLRLFWF